MHDGPRAHLGAAGHPGVLVPALVVEDDLAVGVGRPDDLRNGVGEGSVSLLALTLERSDLLLLEQRVLPPDLDRLLPEVDEDADLRPQDVGLERLHQIVHGAGVVAAEDVLRVLGDRRQEDDRDVAGPLAPLDQLSRLEPVQPRHLDVEQDRGELFLEQVPERLLAGLRAHELLAERLEERFEREQVLGPVVDQQQLRALAHRQHNPYRNGPISSSGRTASAWAAAIAASGIAFRVAVARVLDDPDAAVPLDRGEPGGAVLVGAREHDPDRAVAVCLRHRLEEDVDRGPRELDAAVDGEREPRAVDEEVVVGGRDVDVSRLDGLLVVGLRHRPRDVPLQQRLEPAAGRLG